MGFNSRNKEVLNFRSSDEWIEYYVNSINLFLIKIGVRRFNIGGHSLGAYIALHYFNKFR